MSTTHDHTSDQDRTFALAMKAFKLFNTAQQREALTVFAGLQYPRIEDRLLEAVDRVITRMREPS